MIPVIDHYVGRPVVEVEAGGDDDDWEWGIRFPGNVVIRNHDKRRSSTPYVKDLVLMAVTMDSKATTMKFGKYNANTGTSEVEQEIVLTPTQYSISDSRFEGSPIFPQRPTPEEESLLPQDPSPERVAEGPSEEAESDAKATDAEE